MLELSIRDSRNLNCAHYLKIEVRYFRKYDVWNHKQANAKGVFKVFFMVENIKHEGD